MGPMGQRLLNEVLYDTGEDRHRTQVADRVVQLLQTEARLTPSLAAQLLSKSLASTTSRHLPQFRPKEGLRSWVSRLTKDVSNSELLHHATKIRNQAVHSSGVDWPLRERGD